MLKPSPPATQGELMERANAIAGHTIGELAERFGFGTPEDLLKEKGWMGVLLEYVLGADASSKPEPDFTLLGIELKTIPINRFGKPLETTFVCVAPLTGMTGQTWQSSHVRQKLNHVLWVPILAEPSLAITDRIVFPPFLWQMDEEQEKLLRDDWQELTDMIALGEVENITGKHGQVMQLRPKAANSQAKTKAYDKQGKPFFALPRGFYLKTPFTAQILQQHLPL
ncbi:DNA mismatch repair endonuclease MutH [Thalassotalea agarivorans]|uniref:DNA mismatch repair protein MutH n=1 Tax=Thalassotalea agarivorans TaxID=349064 RepID=A0A1H9ZHG1_THASX|nr:DNA mismatch repair endonuclease MutH [Thalassotalea agarivorans]SES81107.1 DNA mismatch repair protein MutH [Thalassotalea agarivorans]